ncbi:MAG: hypothetical protein AB2A00_24755 [Myxococcota bacterium]
MDRLDEDALAALLHCEFDPARIRPTQLEGRCAALPSDAAGLFRGSVDLKSLRQIASAAGFDRAYVFANLPAALTTECSQDIRFASFYCASGFGEEAATLEFAFGTSSQDALLVGLLVLLVLAGTALLMRRNLTRAAASPVDPQVAWSRALMALTHANTAFGTCYVLLLAALDVPSVIQAFVPFAEVWLSALVMHLLFVAATLTGVVGAGSLFRRTDSTWSLLRAMRPLLLIQVGFAAAIPGVLSACASETPWTGVMVISGFFILLAFVALGLTNMLLGHSAEILTSGELLEALSRPGSYAPAAQRFVLFRRVPSGYVPAPGAALGTVMLPEILVRHLSRRQLIHVVGILAHAHTVRGTLGGMGYSALIGALAPFAYWQGGRWGVAAAALLLIPLFFLVPARLVSALRKSVLARVALTGERAEIEAALRVLGPLVSFPSTWRQDGCPSWVHRTRRALARQHGPADTTASPSAVDGFSLPEAPPADLARAARVRAWSVYGALLSVTVLLVVAGEALEGGVILAGVAALMGVVASLGAGAWALARELERDEATSTRRHEDAGRSGPSVFVGIAPGTSIRLFDGMRAYVDVGHLDLHASALRFRGIRTRFTIAREELVDIRIVEDWRGARTTVLLRYRAQPGETPSVLRVSVSGMRRAGERFQRVKELLTQWTATAPGAASVEGNPPSLQSWRGLSIRRAISHRVIFAEVMAFGGLTYLAVQPVTTLLASPHTNLPLLAASAVALANATRLVFFRFVATRLRRTSPLLGPNMPVAISRLSSSQPR